MLEKFRFLAVDSSYEMVGYLTLRELSEETGLYFRAIMLSVF